MCAVRKTHSTLVFLVVFFFVSALSIHAQVAPAASRSGLSLTAGAEGSVFQPDYAGSSNPDELTSPKRLYGVGAYVDARFTRWVQIEAEGRWLHFNEYDPSGSGQGIGENTYMIGPRVPICNFHGWSPYGKFLIGWGSGAGGWLNGRASAYAFGGGVEYRLSHRLTIRAVDFEYQRWQVNPTLWPYGGSAGISYRFF
jgi:opacity protein-like surface antigen